MQARSEGSETRSTETCTAISDEWMRIVKLFAFARTHRGRRCSIVGEPRLRNIIERRQHITT